MIQIYLAGFALVIIALEIKSLLCRKFLASAIQQHAVALSTCVGRGCFYFLVGLLSLGQWRVTSSTADNDAKGDPVHPSLHADDAWRYFSW